MGRGGGHACGLQQRARPFAERARSADQPSSPRPVLADEAEHSAADLAALALAGQLVSAQVELERLRRGPHTGLADNAEDVLNAALGERAYAQLSEQMLKRDDLDPALRLRLERYLDAQPLQSAEDSLADDRRYKAGSIFNRAVAPSRVSALALHSTRSRPHARQWPRFGCSPRSPKSLPGSGRRSTSGRSTSESTPTRPRRRSSANASSATARSARPSCTARPWMLRSERTRPAPPMPLWRTSTERTDSSPPPRARTSCVLSRASGSRPRRGRCARVGVPPL